MDNSGVQKEQETKNDFLGEIPETAANVAGVIEDDYVITAPWDDPVERDFCFYTLYNFKNKDIFTFAIVPRLDVKHARSALSMNATIKVFEKMNNRTLHLPKLEKYGTVPKLIFGNEAEQQEERDPEWTSRPIFVLSLRHTHILLSALFSFSPNGNVPTIVALHIGLGLCRALAALHRAGFVHRFVTPFNFAIPLPYSLARISENMVMIDLSLAKEWPSMPKSNVPFVGSPKYSSIRIHSKYDQEPPDDLISVIYIVAEFISGKLPWRAIKDINLVKKLKHKFLKTPHFKRLPTELRSLYRELVNARELCMVDHVSVLNVFKNTIIRKDPTGTFQLPNWLSIPYED